MENGKSESELFSELEVLCKSPGYAHAIAYYCFRDNSIRYGEQISVEDVLQQFSRERLARTEISTLIGLLCKGEVDTGHPGGAAIQEYLDRTDELLLGIHKAIIPPVDEIFDKARMGDSEYNPFRNGKVLREAIFYGGESAYNFQYKDLSLIKYEKDNDWFVRNKGYSVAQAGMLVSTLCEIQNEKLIGLFPLMMEKHPEEWTMLPAFMFSVSELADKSGVDVGVVRSLIESFVATDAVVGQPFSSLDDFNPQNAYPIIKCGEDSYILFQSYSLVEALYETPFFWFNDDSEYKALAQKHRGEFAEGFSAERLMGVFGQHRVFTNIDIYRGKRKEGEIDVLVAFSNRAIVLQAKSKKLTIAARKGNDNCLRNDFKKAVQDAYDQALLCSELLTDQGCRLIGADGVELTISRDFKEIYPFCVISEHYPSLSFQVGQFLSYRTTEIVQPPFVMDVFLLDVMTEMLKSPIYFLSYVNRRVNYSKKILSGHELIILSYHLKQNLWVENDVSLIQLGDDIGADLDLAMMVRRSGVPGRDTPEGILTKFKGTFFGRLIGDIDGREDAATIDLGFMLLYLSEETVKQINDGMQHLCALYARDGKSHDLTLLIGAADTGLTIHCNNDSPKEAGLRLRGHCYKRKYASKAKTWFGMCIDPINNSIRFGLELDFEWQKSSEMDELTSSMPKGQHLKQGQKINITTRQLHAKRVGRNDPCPCGSGKKYKKCCIA